MLVNIMDTATPLKPRSCMMHTQAASHSRYTHAAYTYTYNTINTIRDVATTIQSVIPSQATQLALVTITLHFEQHYKQHFEGHFENDEKLLPHLQVGADQSTRYLLDNLRPLVRKTDVVLLLDHTFHFL